MEWYSQEWIDWINSEMPEGIVLVSFPKEGWTEDQDERGRWAKQKYFLMIEYPNNNYAGALLTVMDDDTLGVQTSYAYAAGRDTRDHAVNRFVVHARNVAKELAIYRRDTTIHGNKKATTRRGNH